MSDHERIYLQPECCADEMHGRTWCQDRDPEDCDEGVPWTEYVRADLVMAKTASTGGMGFKGWWNDIGSGARPEADEDGEEHCHRVSEMAFEFGFRQGYRPDRAGCVRVAMVDRRGRID